MGLNRSTIKALTAGGWGMKRSGRMLITVDRLSYPGKKAGP
jgi:hypothetical protein